MKYKVVQNKSRTYSIEELRNKLLYYINYKVRSKHEAIKKLEELSANPEQIESLIKEFSELNLINDEKFIIFLIQDILEFKKVGIIHMKMKLKKRGFHSDLIQDTLEKFLSEQEYSEEQAAFEQLLRKYNHQNLPSESQKMLAFLGRKGFSYSVSSKALKRFFDHYADEPQF